MTNEREPIRAAEVPRLLLAACPWLAEGWPEQEQEYADPAAPGGRLGYLDASWAVDRALDRLAGGEVEAVDGFFALIEELIRRGDAYVSELGVIGYLESLQQGVRSRGLPEEAVVRRLLPLSARYWRAVTDFWEHGIPIPNLPRD